nr:YdcF family protein [Alphaproteobacteria bacterium]
SGYHMPRSLMELKRALPGTTLIPHAVMPASLHQKRWWLHRTTMRVLVSEYLKFIPSAARYAASRIVRGWGERGTGDGDKNAHAEL